MVIGLATLLLVVRVLVSINHGQDGNHLLLLLFYEFPKHLTTSHTEKHFKPYIHKLLIVLMNQ